MSDHDAEIEEDFEGWTWLSCSCGFEAGPFPGSVEATDELVDHIEAAALAGVEVER